QLLSSQHVLLYPHSFPTRRSSDLGHVGSAVCHPVAVKFKVDIVRVGVFDQDVIGGLAGVHFLQLAVVVVIEQLDALLRQGAACVVQALGKLGYFGFAAVIKAVHAGDDNGIGAEALGQIGD